MRNLEMSVFYRNIVHMFASISQLHRQPLTQGHQILSFRYNDETPKTNDQRRLFKKSPYSSPTVFLTILAVGSPSNPVENQHNEILFAPALLVSAKMHVSANT